MNLINIFAAFALGFLVVFTALGMYIQACRSTYLHVDGPTNRMILEKFRTQADLQHFCRDHEAKVAADADATLQRFALAFTNEVAQTHLGRNHPTPKARFSDFI